MDHLEYVYTFGMDESGLADYLRSRATGVLALADAGDAYAVPVGYHFDGERLLVRLGVHEDSEKLDSLGATDRATFLVYETDGPDRSWSVLARGTIRELGDPAEGDVSDETVNDLYDPIRVFGEDVAALSATLYEFRIEEVTGRRTADPGETGGPGDAEDAGRSG
jgi:hypothetical protein